MPGVEIIFHADKCLAALVLGSLCCVLGWLCFREGLRQGIPRGIRLERLWVKKQRAIARSIAPTDPSIAAASAAPPGGDKSLVCYPEGMRREPSRVSSPLPRVPSDALDLAKTVPAMPVAKRPASRLDFVPGPRSSSTPPPIPGARRVAPFDYESIALLDPAEQSMPIILDAIAEEIDLLDLAPGDPIFVKVGMRLVQAVADSAPEMRAGVHAARVRGPTISPSGRAWIELKYIQRRRVN